MSAASIPLDATRKEELAKQRSLSLIPFENAEDQKRFQAELEQATAAALAEEGMVKVRNPHLKDMHSDHLYHLGFSRSDPLPELFGDVKLVVVGGSVNRMMVFSKQAAQAQDMPVSHVIDHTRTDRYCMYKAGRVLCVNHGIGMPSASIMLHEVAKLLHYARARDVSFVRMGTSGGVGVPAGSIVVTTEALNGLLEPKYTIPILGRMCSRNTQLSPELAQELVACAPSDRNVVTGRTLCCDTFYEGQARLDGAVCDYTEEDKFAFLAKVKDAGVVNVEMESLVFSAFCNTLDLRGGVICTTLLNRLEGDQVTSDHELLGQYVDGPLLLLCNYIRKHLGPCKSSAPPAAAAAAQSDRTAAASDKKVRVSSV